MRNVGGSTGLFEIRKQELMRLHEPKQSFRRVVVPAGAVDVKGHRNLIGLFKSYCS
jgi:hypothetical protein